MSKKKYKTQSEIRDSVMGKLGKVRGKTGKFVDWQEVDKATVGNTVDFWSLLKRVFNIAMGKKDESKT